MKILLVEDDVSQARLVNRVLVDNHIVHIAPTIEKAEYSFHVNMYDLFIVDLKLSDGRGSDFCEYVRKNGSNAAILMLTASALIDDKVESFSAGADDYLSKPFHANELKARVNALARRSSQGYSPDVLQVGDLMLNRVTKVVESGGQRIELRPKEFEILEYLMKNRGCVLSRTMIMDHIWDDGKETMSNTIDVHIKNLRRCLDQPNTPSIIATVRGFGYKIEERP